MATNNNISAVIISADQVKVAKLKNLISRFYTLNISNVCNTEAAAIEVLNHFTPTILFMDIAHIGIMQDVKKPPFIVGLCDTIYTKRVKQFLKMGFFEVFYAPYEEGELNSIMGKILNIYCAYNSERQLQTYVQEGEISYRVGGAAGRSGSLFLMGTRNEESTRIVFDEVLYLSKVGNYVCVNFVDKSKKYYRSNLKIFHRKFPSDKFQKINRSVVVNLDKVAHVNRNKVVLVDDEEFEVSRSFKKEFKETLLNS